MQRFIHTELHIDLAWRSTSASHHLSAKDKIRLRDNGVTLEAIAQELGINREWARQIEAKALVKCRKWCQRNGYWLEDLIRYV